MLERVESFDLYLMTVRNTHSWSFKEDNSLQLFAKKTGKWLVQWVCLKGEGQDTQFLLSEEGRAIIQFAFLYLSC